MNTEQTTQATIVYLTVNQFCKKHTAFTLGGIRALIFNEYKNGINNSGAVIRLGRKVLIDEAKFLNWVASQSSEAA
jgi:hypothetical protein